MAKLISGTRIYGNATIDSNVNIGGNILALAGVLSTLNINSSTAAVTSTSGALVVTGGAGIGGNLYVGGNLVIAGNLITYNANNLTIDDSIIYLAANNGADTADIGIVGHFINPGYQHTGFVRDASDGVWKLFANVTAEPTTTVDFTNATYSNIKVGNVIAQSVIATNFIGNGSALTGLPAGYSNVQVATYLPTYTGASGITSVGTLSSLTMGGNITLAGTGTNDISSGTGDGASFTTYNIAVRSWWGIGFRDYQNLGTVKAYLDTRAGSWGLKGTISVNGDNAATAIANGGTSGVGNIGATGAAFNTVFAKATSAQYADLAEVYRSDTVYAPGNVVIFGGENEITISTQSHDPRIAGVVSTNPAYLMNDAAAGLPIALQGRVPCRVLGPINKGDRLVASQYPGVAQRLNSTLYEPGCIIGKSLEAIELTEIKTIEVVVGRL